MPGKRIPGLLAAALLAWSAAAGPAHAKPALLPLPASVTPAQGSFRLKPDTMIVFPRHDLGVAIEDLFRMFEQRNADRTGLGLGLAISRKGVEESGGAIHVRDMPGKGCVFTIDLPRQTNLAPAGAP